MLDQAFAKLSSVPESDDLKPQGMKDLAIALGVLIDKRRLEDGQPTARTEATVHTPTDAAEAETADYVGTVLDALDRAGALRTH